MRPKLYILLTKLIALFVFAGYTTTGIYGQAPVANFTANVTSGCAPLTVSFTDQSTGNPLYWNWDFGNSQLSNIRNPVVTYALPGIYTVRLVVRNATGISQEEKIDYITVAASPTPAFTANITTSCAPAIIQFTDQTTPAGSITQWQWNFGDGGTSTQQNPSHTYTASGFYSVSLTVTSNNGCRISTSYTNYIRIVSGISTNFSFTQPTTCTAPFIVTFQNQASGPGVLSYTWDFGNGSPPSNLPNPTTTYAAAGSYIVRLDVVSNLGCTGSFQQTINIAGTSTDFIVPSPVCAGSSVTFQNNSSPAPVSSTWNFGDATTSSQINPIKTFITAGTYQVKLINQYANCIDSITKPVTVVNKPVVNFIADDSTSCSAPFTVSFTDLSVAATSWLWAFGDGSTSTLQNPSHQYISFGNYTVTLTIGAGTGCSNTFSKPNYIQVQKTQVSITNLPAGGCVPFSFSPIASIQTVDNIVAYNWDMGEAGGTYTIPSPTHTYNTPGNYTITLTVTTQSGCIETITVPNGVRTGVPPVVNFSYTPTINICASTPVSFTDLSTTTPGALVIWQWDFGDGGTSIQQNPVHVFTDTGAVTVRLIISNNGCIDSLKQTLQILPPVANFGYKLTCNNRLQVIFSDSSLTNPVYGPITYQWQMGDPLNTIFNTIAPPTFTYPAYGTYNVTLIVTNGPCSYQITKPVIVSDNIVNIGINKNPVCKNEVFTLSSLYSNPAVITSYTWTIGAFAPVNGGSTYNYSIATPGSYGVTLTMVDSSGCILTKTVPNFITVRGPLANFIPSTPGGCKNKTTTFTDLTTPAGSIVNWDWNFGDGAQQVFTSPPFNHTYLQTGGYAVSLTVTDAAGCKDTYTMPANLLVTNPLTGFRSDTFYCPNALLQFSDTSSGLGLSYQWSFGDGGSSVLQNPQHSYPAGDNIYSVKLVITDQSGCKDSLTKNNYVKIRSPKPAFTLSDTASFCPPLLTRFTFQGQDYKSFSWGFGDGGISTLKNPDYFYNLYGTFTPKLYLTGPGGCIDSAQATVHIYNPATDAGIVYTPLSSCNSAQVNFILTMPPGIKFIFYYGDGAIDSSQQKVLTHLYSSPGNYYPYIHITDATGCVTVINGAAGPVQVFGAIPLFGKDKKEFCDQGQVFFTNFTLNNDPIVSSIWDFGDNSTSTVTDPSHTYATPGTYLVSLNVTTLNQCSSSFVDTIRVYRTPNPIIGIRDTICLNVKEQFNGQLAQSDTSITWQWNFGNNTTSSLRNPGIIYTATGDYTIQLMATNKLGCTNTVTKKINVAPPPTAVAVTDPLIIAVTTGANLNMNYTGNIINYSWTPFLSLDCFNCPAPFANPINTTKYTVQVTDRYGCINKGSVTVQVVCNNKNFFIPNLFTPNGDGNNDVFYPRGVGLFRIKSLRIFDRWGEVVFERREFQANDPGVGWDGKYKGKNPVAGVYIYQIEIYCDNNELVRLGGNVALIQ